MRLLDRGSAPVPPCLAGYNHGQHTWDDVTGAHKADIRSSLEQMQGRRCAYCEGSLDILGQHIEHFRRKHSAHFPHLAFTWTNLYWSCNQTDSCGRYKDHSAGPYNPNDLLDPCVDDPDHVFRFRSDGSISIRPGLSPADQRKAEETLRVFNLQPRWGRLRNMRKAAVAGYVALVEGAADFTLAELREFFAEELATAAALPFSTVIRHVLTEP
jgi:uncharacterized protein (TIGR02646 family)